MTSDLGYNQHLSRRKENLETAPDAILSYYSQVRQAVKMSRWAPYRIPKYSERASVTPVREVRSTIHQQSNSASVRQSPLERSPSPTREQRRVPRRPADKRDKHQHYAAHFESPRSSYIPEPVRSDDAGTQTTSAVSDASTQTACEQRSRRTQAGSSQTTVTTSTQTEAAPAKRPRACKQCKLRLRHGIPCPPVFERLGAYSPSTSVAATTSVFERLTPAATNEETTLPDDDNILVISEDVSFDLLNIGDLDLDLALNE